MRRERRVEKALENCRLTDILRWAAADELIVGKTPTGALYTGSYTGRTFRRYYDRRFKYLVEGWLYRIIQQYKLSERLAV